MKRVATLLEEGRVVGIVDGPDFSDVRYEFRGRIYYWDHDRWAGPDFLDPEGNSIPVPDEHSDAWRAWSQWLKYNVKEDLQ